MASKVQDLNSNSDMIKWEHMTKDTENIDKKEDPTAYLEVNIDCIEGCDCCQKLD